MTDVIARFDRGPRDEVRASLVNRGGQIHLELRVYDKPATGEQEAFPSGEGITVPLGLFGKLFRAIQAVEIALRRRSLLQREVPEIRQMVGGEATVVSGPQPPSSVRGEIRHLARNQLRLRLDCPMEYVEQRELQRRREPARRHGRTKDISRMGAQVLLPERVSILTMLHVTIHLPVGVIALPCEVVWTEHLPTADIAREGCRHGLRFTQMGSEELSLLDRLLGDAAREASGPPG